MPVDPQYLEDAGERMGRHAVDSLVMTHGVSDVAHVLRGMMRALGAAYGISAGTPAAFELFQQLTDDELTTAATEASLVPTLGMIESARRRGGPTCPG